MAEAPATGLDGKYIEDLKQTFLICCVCQDEFTDDTRHPRLLRCLHSVCYSCLQKLVKEEKVRCPLCNDVTSIPSNNLSIIRKDNTRRDLLDFVSVRTHSTGINCTQCEDDKAVSRCAECKDFLCKGCTHAHQVTKITKSHPVSTIERLQNMSLTEFSGKLKCQKAGHEQYTLDLYCCKEECRHPICTLCALAEHKESNRHKIEDVSSTYETEKKETEEHLARAVDTDNEVKRVIKDVKDEIHNVEVNAMDLENSIKAAFNNCKKMLERREQQLIMEVKQHCEQKVKALSQQQRCLDEFQTELSDSITFTHGVLKGYSPTAFLQVHRRINERHEDLFARRFDQSPHATSNMIFNTINMGSDFQKHALKLGNVQSFDVFPDKTRVLTCDALVGQTSKVVQVSLFDSEDKLFPEEKADVQVRILDSSSQPMTPFLTAEYSSEDRAFIQVVTGEDPGDYMAEVFVCGTQIGEGFKFKIKQSKPGDVPAMAKSTEEKAARPKEIPPPKTKATRAEQTKSPAAGPPGNKKSHNGCNVLTGNQPKGTMDTRVEKSPSLPGYDGCGTIVITYDIPGGIQTEEHANPKKPFSGTKRTAYLPDNDKGRKITNLLRVAFERRLVFTVGVSKTTGMDNCVIWAEISHKTNRHGGPQMFGYPDPAYLDQIVDQLATKGVTEKDLPK